MGVSSDQIKEIIDGVLPDSNSIIIKTPVETIEISKEDYETKKIRLVSVPNTNILMILHKDKRIALFLNELSITILNK